MKILLLPFAVFLAALSFAQQSLTAEFDIKMTPYEGRTIKYAQRSGQLSAKLISETSEEYVIIDNQQKKALEMFNASNAGFPTKGSVDYEWEHEFTPESEPVTEVYWSVIAKPFEQSDYKLLSQKKTISGKECQKLHILAEGKKVGEGWVMLGVQMELEENAGWMRTKEGTIVEAVFSYPEITITYTLKKLDFIASPEDFYFIVPEDYNNSYEEGYENMEFDDSEYEEIESVPDFADEFGLSEEEDNSFVQQPLTAEFKFTASPDNFTVRVSQRPDQISATLKKENITEYLVIDRKEKKMLELGEYSGEDVQRTSLLQTWETYFSPEINGMTEVFTHLVSLRANESYYRLLPEKKMLFGKECQKIELVGDGRVVGNGWIMKGVQIELTKMFGWMRTAEGMIVELYIPYGEYTISQVLTKLEFKASPADFSFEVPEGYSEYSDSEEDYIIPEPGDENYVAPESDE